MVIVSGSQATAVAPGQVTITATVGSVSGTASLTVNPTVAAEVMLEIQDTVPAKG